eukprot:TRINITY_DN13666_c0_g1_i1.p1 TRINITY_DN13666_c0_g1~~TRINITY_DN13666_c0_g1_i1.p1  ORF type:complete len:309 (+),score=110.19 TRINITY_DN13666_c0_g1_i1:134-1060(+)
MCIRATPPPATARPGHQRAATARGRVSKPTYVIGETVEVGRESQRFYKVTESRPTTARRVAPGTAGTARGTRDAGFRSEALQLEVQLSEQLARLNKRSSDPVVIAQRRQAVEAVLDQVIAQDHTYGSLLARIKEEWGPGPGGSEASGDVGAGVELQVENEQLSTALNKAHNDNTMLAREVQLLKKEASELKHLVHLKSEELAHSTATRQLAQDAPPRHKQQMLSGRISELEHKLHGTEHSGALLAGWAEVEAVMGQKEQLEEQVIQLTAQLKISQRREGEAQTAMGEMRQQLQSRAVAHRPSPVHIPS